jgi:hypothetical protein
MLKAVLRIHDILVWIRIRGSMHLTNGSGSGFGSGSVIIDLQDTKKTNFLKKIFCILLLKVHLHNF